MGEVMMSPLTVQVLAVLYHIDRPMVWDQAVAKAVVEQAKQGRWFSGLWQRQPSEGCILRALGEMVTLGAIEHDRLPTGKLEVSITDEGCRLLYEWLTEPHHRDPRQSAKILAGEAEEESPRRRSVR